MQWTLRDQIDSWATIGAAYTHPPLCECDECARAAGLLFAAIIRIEELDPSMLAARELEAPK